MKKVNKDNKNVRTEKETRTKDQSKDKIQRKTCLTRRETIKKKQKESIRRAIIKIKLKRKATNNNNENKKYKSTDVSGSDDYQPYINGESYKFRDNDVSFHNYRLTELYQAINCWMYSCVFTLKLGKGILWLKKKESNPKRNLELVLLGQKDMMLKK